jgi:hypothetical protein
MFSPPMSRSQGLLSGKTTGYGFGGGIQLGGFGVLNQKLWACSTSITSQT